MGLDGLAFATPLILGIALGSKQPNDPDATESRFVGSLSGLSCHGRDCAWILAGSFHRAGDAPHRHRSGLAKMCTCRSSPRKNSTGTRRARSNAFSTLAGFELLTQPPPFLVRTSMRVMRAIGGPSVQRYIPERLASTWWIRRFGSHFTRVAYCFAAAAEYAPSRTVWPWRLLREPIRTSLTDPAAQEVEREIRQIWRVYEENPRAHEGSRWLEGPISGVSERIARLETSYDDWQTVTAKLSSSEGR